MAVGASRETGPHSPSPADLALGLRRRDGVFDSLRGHGVAVNPFNQARPKAKASCRDSELETEPGNSLCPNSPQ